MNFLRSDWCGLSWTFWYPFSHSQALKNIPIEPGVYRVRAVGAEELFYIGETGRNLRERLRGLRSNVLQEAMPFNDPHTAAPSLWAWRHAENLDFECSVAPITLAVKKEEARKRREGLEFYLLWRYRLEYGSSTRCNHGRFHPRYTKSTDRQRGIRGKRLPDDVPDNKAGGLSLPPLQMIGAPIENDWMGLTWNTPQRLIPANIQNMPKAGGVYKIFDLETKELLYVGESQNLKSRLTTHARKIWQHSDPLFSFVELPHGTLAYQRHEIENDLLGGFYAYSQTMPKFQLINHRPPEKGEYASVIA